MAFVTESQLLNGADGTGRPKSNSGNAEPTRTAPHAMPRRVFTDSKTARGPFT
jgi:hypothetical protein